MTKQDTLNERIGKKVKLYRSAKRLTQQVLAKRAGVGIATIANIEKGSNARAATLEKISIALDIPVTRLLSGHEDE